MLLFSRRYVLLAGPSAALGACGFTPVYGPDGQARALWNQVEIEERVTEEGYLLVRNLEERLGRTSSGDFTLATEIRVSEQGQGVTEEGNITRFSIVGRVDYEMRANESGDVVARGNVENFTGYSATGTTVETLAAQSDARERLMQIMADQIVTRLLAGVDENS
ncbi:MAG: LPS assembly lipoprotein LptE [Arenibacterium sp.]